ncbi:putative chaperonin containing t-complex protein [Trypanosoma grayi]|uniref:putative chaperonin containing t-complex protein n=1 Tax=Trypanosoma grayi TaxID=71804 RepID=UPI0004F429B3|nr:putative chaperonin containing t-complex protein [Trypanosoma grayi]KEG06843.1 putative chaperonin containing t-complex protein [Trypanosoma grayi]
MLFANQAQQVLRDGASEEKGERARLMNIMGAVSVADMVKTTLGPKGMDKILQGMDRAQSTRVTNDGATILKSLFMDNPAGKILIDMSRTQDDEVGDGTTSVTVLAGELLRNAEKLLDQSIHPQTIIEGYRLAAQVAREALVASSEDHGNDEKLFYDDLLCIAKTTLSSKIITVEKEHFAKLCVDAVLRLKGSGNLEMINIMKKLGGTLRDSYLEPGFLLDKKIGTGQPRCLENAKILVANTPMDTDKIKIFGAKVRVDSVAQLAEVEASEKEKMKNKCMKIIKHDIHCFINRQLIYNYPEEIFAQHGIMAIEHADFEGIERLAKALGADVISQFDETEKVKYGFAEKIDEIMIGESTVIRFSGLPKGEACTIVVRGTSQHILDEAERSIHDALCVISQTINETRTVLGAGCSEFVMARAVDEKAKTTPGKKQLAMIAFANALRMLPAIIADNAGLDSNDLVTRLQAEHYQGHSTYGIDVVKGDVADVKELRITESFKVKSSVLGYAAEAAEMILRVDDVLRAVPRKRTQ